MIRLLVDLLSIAFTLFELLIFARVLLSWVQLDPYHPIVRFIHDATEPILAPVRKLVPPVSGFDLSPMIVLIGAVVLQRLVIGLIYNFLL